VPLDSTQTEIFHQIEAGYKNGDDIQTVLSRISPEQFAEIKPIAKESYKMIRNVLDHVDPGLHQLRALMAPCANIYRNEIQWVKIEHIDAWKYAKLPQEDRCQHPATPIHSPPYMTLSHQMSPSLIRDQTPHTEESHHVSLDAISYDPWVLIHPPHVSSMDCEDVDRLTHWIHSEVHLLNSSSEAIATKLVMDNCPHIERLKARLLREPHYLLSLGVPEDDSNDIKNAILGAMQSSGSRGWCNVS
jgi:hypothetical protein